MIIKHQNRHTTKVNIHRGFWCFGCDAFIVKPDAKCPICGTRNMSNGKRRFSVSTARRMKDVE